MRSDTTTMSAMSHQPMGGRRRSAVNHVIDSVSAGRPDLLRHPSRPAPSRHGVDADDVGARQHGGRHRRGRAPVAFRRGPAAERLAHERLARRTDEHRPIERRGQCREPCQHTIAVVRPFGKPDARDRRSRVPAATPAAAATAMLASSSAVTSATTIVVHGLGVHRLRPAAHVHQHERGLRRRRRRRRAAGSYRNPLMSLMIEAPSPMTARATSAL